MVIGSQIALLLKVVMSLKITTANNNYSVITTS